MKLNRGIEKQVLALFLVAALGRANLPAQAFSVLHTFTVGGAGLERGLVLSGNTLYGTTYGGNADNGNPPGFGTVFKVNTDGTGFTTLYTFIGESDGADPEGGLVLSGNTLYGTTTTAGTSSHGFGTVFKVNTDGTGFAPLYFFGVNGRVGTYPCGSLVLSGSTLYGTTARGGDNSGYGYGTVFRANTDDTGFATLYAFRDAGDGAVPAGGLVLSGSTLYGTTTQAGAGPPGFGTVFKFNTDGTGFTTLYAFTGLRDGGKPVGALVLSGNTLYGTTQGGEAYSVYGTVFKVNTDGTGFTTLYIFSGGNDGAVPAGGLVLSGNTLYGTTEGGSAGSGTAFEVNTDGTGFATLWSFSGGSDGSGPQDGLVLSGSTLYGTTTAGGSNGVGTVFALAIPSLSVAWIRPDAVTYGTALGAAQLDATANYPGLFAYSPPPGTVLEAGTNILSVVFTPTGTVDYPATNLSVPLVVSPAVLTVTAGNASRQYGQNNPVLTGSVTGVANGDNITATYTCSATAASPPGNYPIVPSMVDPNSRLSNYSLLANNGVLTVLTLFPTVEYEFQADFDGRDWLVIQGATARWQHFDYTPVGLHNPSYPAMIMSSSVNGVALVNGASWIPSWPNGTGSGAWSSTYGGLIPALPPNPAWVSLNVVSGRGPVSIVQLPSDANTNTLIVEFNDDTYGGDALYDVQIFVATESPLLMPLERNGRLVLTWSAAPGQAYQVQYKDDLTQTAWLALGSPITATNVTATSSDTITNRARFYRVRLYP